MKNSYIAQLKAQAANNTDSVSVNTNASTNMTNIKSVEIAVNLILSANGASAGFFDKVQSKSNGKTLVKGRSLSAVRVKGEDESIFGVFVPLPEQRTCKHGRNNTAVVIFHMEDGSTKILDAAQTEEFWADVLDLEEGVSATDIDFSVICDIPGYDADEANEMLRNNEARSIRIKFDGMPQFGTAVNKTHHRFSLRPVNASVDFSSATVGDDPNVVVFNNTRNVLSAKTRSIAKFDASSFKKQSTSSKRREARKAKAKAQSQAARQSVERVVYFDGAPVETVDTPAEVVETPVVETPVVDAEKEALRKENAELKAQVAELSANVANLTAMMQQFMASQAQPVAAPAPVVEEVTPEPEVVEETVEEEVEAPKASQPSAADFLAARKAAADAEKARKTSNESDEVDADFYMVDFD